MAESKIVKRVNFYSLIFSSIIFSLIFSIIYPGAFWRAENWPFVFGQWIAAVFFNSLFLFAVPFILALLIGILYKYFILIFNRYVEINISYIIVWLAFIMVAIGLSQQARQHRYQAYLKGTFEGCIERAKIQYPPSFNANEQCTNFINVMEPILLMCYRHPNTSSCFKDSMKKITSCQNGRHSWIVLKTCINTTISLPKA